MRARESEREIHYKYAERERKQEDDSGHDGMGRHMGNSVRSETNGPKFQNHPISTQMGLFERKICLVLSN